MRLAMMSYTMARQPGFDLVRMFRLSQSLKLQGVDMVTLHDRDPRDLRRMADDHGVPIIAHTFLADLNQPTSGMRQPGVDAARRGVDAAVVLGAPCVMIVTPGKTGESRDEARTRWIAGLKEVMPHAKACGIALTVENFPGEYSPFVTASDFLEAQRYVPELKLTFDSGNAAGGEDPAESYRRCAPHVVHAHFKDWQMAAEGASYCRMLNGDHYRAALIGEGLLDHRSVVAAMRTGGYRSFIDIEYEGNEYRPDEAVRRAAGYLRELGCE